MSLIDTHCHINFPDSFPDPAKAVSDAVAAGVTRLIAVGCDMESSRSAVELAQTHREVYAIVGWHPNYTANYDPATLEEIASMCENPKVVAIGEIGLDFHWKFATREQQERALRDQLRLAREIGKPVVFHCREAYPAMLDILEGEPRHPYLFHCWSGDAADAARAMALDAYFGVDGPITYKSASDLRDLVRTLPRDRIVVETDSPYMTPVPHRGKPNAPAYTVFVNNGLASCLGFEIEDCARLTTENAERFFRL